MEEKRQRRLPVAGSYASMKPRMPNSPPAMPATMAPRIGSGVPVLGHSAVAFALKDWAISGALTYQTAFVNGTSYMGRPTGTGTTPISQWLGRGPGGAQLKKNSDGSYMNPWSVDWTDLGGNKRTDPLDINCKCFDPNKTLVLNPAAWELVPNGQWAAQTQVIPSLIYMEAFKHFHFGEAAAMGVMMGLLVFAVTYYQMTKIGKQRLF